MAPVTQADWECTDVHIQNIYIDIVYVNTNVSVCNWMMYNFIFFNVQTVKTTVILIKTV